MNVKIDGLKNRKARSINTICQDWLNETVNNNNRTTPTFIRDEVKMEDINGKVGAER